MPKTKMPKKLIIRGKGRVFQVGMEDGEFQCYLLESERVAPAPSVTTFIECRNICGEAMKNQCRGAAVAFYITNADSWKLGVVSSLTTKSLKVFVWTGPIIGIDTMERTPEFLTSNERWESLQMHFTPECYTLSDDIYLNFLNQVTGCRSGGTPLKNDVINNLDHKAQFSSEGPDMLLPHLNPIEIPPIAVPANVPAIISANIPANVPAPANLKRKAGGCLPVNFVPSKSKNKYLHLPAWVRPQHKRLASPQTTYYIKVGDAKRVEISVGDGDLVKVPYIFTPGRFASMTSQQFNDFSAYDGKLGLWEFDQFLQKHYPVEKDLHVVDERKHEAGVRIRLLQTSLEVESLGEVETAAEGIWVGMETGHVHEGTGVLVSCWVRDQHIHPEHLTLDDCEVIDKALKGGNGERKICVNKSGTAFIGPRQSNRPLPSPISGPGRDVGESYYSWEKYDAKYLPFVERISNLFSQRASDMARWIDPVIVCSLPGGDANSSVTGPCATKLVTYGREGEPIGFVNGNHIDSGDKSKRKKLEEWKAKKKTEIKDLEETHGEKVKNQVEYLKRFVDTLGIGVPTTCGYQFVGENEDDEIIQYFLMNGLGMCVRMGSFIGHMFYAFAFTHQTAVPLLIRNGKVHFISDGTVNIFAWGASNSES